jgi:predicted RNase H-like HicB family nuclease
MRYGIIIEPAGDGFSGHVPDLPGCVAAGGSVEEVRELLEDAVHLHIDSLAQSREPVPSPTIVCDYVVASGSTS